MKASDHYAEAVGLVFRDRNASTSFLQRRLQIGYNHATALMERMEAAGLVSCPNRAGKREVLLARPLPQPCEEGPVASWRAGIAAIDPKTFHPPGMLAASRSHETSKGRTVFEPAPWPAVHAAMIGFVEEWGTRAAALGWATEQLFGVHRLAGAIRMDSTGALVTPHPMRVVSMDGTTIVLARDDTRQTFRGLTNPAESVPIWAFGRPIAS